MTTVNLKEAVTLYATAKYPKSGDKSMREEGQEFTCGTLVAQKLIDKGFATAEKATAKKDK